MNDLFLHFWWLIFPVGFMVVGVIHNWFAYLRRRDELAVLRTYAEKGQTPPPGLSAGEDLNPAAAYGPMGWGWRRWRPFGPYWEWRRAAIFGAISAGLHYAAWSDRWPHAEVALEIGALVTGVIAVAALVGALFLTFFPPKG